MGRATLFFSLQQINVAPFRITFLVRLPVQKHVFEGNGSVKCIYANEFRKCLVANPDACSRSKPTRSSASFTFSIPRLVARGNHCSGGGDDVSGELGRLYC